MKNYYFSIKRSLILLLLLFSSCSDVLDIQPRDRFSENVVWSDIEIANSFLDDAYRNLNIINGFSSIIDQDAVADDLFFIHVFGIDTYLQGNITASNQGPFIGNYFNHLNWELYNNIQNINTFLDNIDIVLEGVTGTQLTNLQTRVDRMKGEAHFLRAYSYAQMAKTYGGLPIIEEPFNIGDDFLTIERSSFEETIDFIVQECDKAAELLLSKNEMEMGRATKGAALALKSRTLLFAASDLTADGNAANSYVGYENPNRTSLWIAARDAARDVIDLGVYELADFGAPNHEAVAQNYYDFFRQKDLSNNEIIWGKMFHQSEGDARQTNLHNGPNGNSNWGSNNPTQDLVDTYQMEDGSNFYNHFEVDGDGFYQNISTVFQSENPYQNREPRFYGSILYDQAIFQPRLGEIEPLDPVGVYDRRTRRIVEGGEVISNIPGIDTRQGPVSREDGGYTGYLMKKHMDHEIVGQSERNDNAWITFRYAEIILNYAEALLELGEIAEATSLINQIRNRAGLPDFEGDILDALRYERRIELAFEWLRWYDIRRWKVLEESLTSTKGMDILELTNRDDDTVTTSWRQIHVQSHNIEEKMYWIPIEDEELNRAPQLVQNPGY